MASDTYTTSLRLQLQGYGNNNNAWGSIANTDFALIEAAITGDNGYAGGAGGINLTGLTAYSLTVVQGGADQARQQLYPFVGPLTAQCVVNVPGVVKIGYALNATSGGFPVKMQVSGAGGSITLPAGSGWTLFYCDGTNVTQPSFNYGPSTFSGAVTFSSTVAIVGAVTLTAGISVGGNATVTGNLSVTGLASGMGMACVGDLKVTATATTGAGWYLCYGQAVSRTTYAALFAAIGTTWGIGDGSTTFNLPDFRGRTFAGVDAMGGTAANRLTQAVSGITGGAILGASGGDQNVAPHTLLSATTSVTIIDPGHVHGTTIWAPYAGYQGGTDGTSHGAAPTNTASATTGITATASTTISDASPGVGANVQPTAVVNVWIFAGV